MYSEASRLVSRMITLLTLKDCALAEVYFVYCKRAWSCSEDGDGAYMMDDEPGVSYVTDKVWGGSSRRDMPRAVRR